MMGKINVRETSISKHQKVMQPWNTYAHTKSELDDVLKLSKLKKNNNNNNNKLIREH